MISNPHPTLATDAGAKAVTLSILLYFTLSYLSLLIAHYSLSLSYPYPFRHPYNICQQACGCHAHAGTRPLDLQHAGFVADVEVGSEREAAQQDGQRFAGIYPSCHNP